MERHGNKLRRRGMGMVYIIVSLPVMFGICSLAVDLGRVQCAKTELRTATDAAACAAASVLRQGSSAAQAQAITTASQNLVDSTPLALDSSNVVIGTWNTTTRTFQSGGTANNSTIYQAVQVSGLRTAANGNPVPLVFGIIIGMPACNVTATSIAAVITEPTSTTEYISAHGDPWLSGEPAGTKASEPDVLYNAPSANDVHPWKQDIANPGLVQSAAQAAGSSGNYSVPADGSKVYGTDYSNDEPYGSPSGIAMKVTPGTVVQVSIPLNASNIANNQGYLNSGTDNTYANGDDAGDYNLVSDDAANPTFVQGTLTTSGTEHGISNIITPLNSVVGVFMDQNGASYGADSSQESSESSAPATPAGLDFSMQTQRDYTSIQPKLNQSFYVGNGQTSTGVSQTIVVPPNAYELFLGTMDGHEWSNNVGGYTATITQYQIQMVQ